MQSCFCEKSRRDVYKRQVIGYVVAYFMIGKFHFATPGRLGNYTDDGAEEEDQGSTPVSYTHLSAKRRRSSRYAFSSSDWKQQGSGNQGHDPVSYTHLDVYKRQR